jgi:hypothetical protein
MTQPVPNTQTLIEKIQSLPADRIAEVEDFVDFLKERTQPHRPTPREPLNFPVDDPGPWPEGLSLHREGKLKAFPCPPFQTKPVVVSGQKLKN